MLTDPDEDSHTHIIANSYFTGQQSHAACNWVAFNLFSSCCIPDCWFEKMISYSVKCGTKDMLDSDLALMILKI